MKVRLFVSVGLILAAVAIATPAFASCDTTAKKVTELASTRSAAQALPPATVERGGELRANPASTAQAASGIVGLWMTNVIVGGQPFGQGFEAFTSDGLEVLNDTSAPSTGNVCLGVWTVAQYGDIKVKHPAWSFDEAGNLIGTIVIGETLTLGRFGDTFRGTLTVDIYDLNLVLVGHLDGQVTGRRISVD